MNFSGYANYDGLGLAGLVKQRQVSPLELIEAAIERIEKHNPTLNAVIYKTYDRARARAAGPLPDGAFKGVPFLMKDIAGHEQGVPTRQGSRFLPAVPAAEDSVLTRRFLEAGLIPLGKTNVPEFGLLPVTEPALYGPARNPWNKEHSTGGSSGGAAAAVAAGITPLAHANDGGGSIRIPASCCGIVGLKPSRGRNPCPPEFGDVTQSLAVEHIVSRSVRDTAAMLDCTACPQPGSPHFALPKPPSYLKAIAAPPKRLRVAFWSNDLAGRPLHQECAAAVTKAAKVCAALGHETGEAAPPLPVEQLTEAFMEVWGASLAAGIDAIAAMTGRAAGPDQMEGLTWGLYQWGKTIEESRYRMAWALFYKTAQALEDWHRRYDVWLTPTLAGPPLKLGMVDINETDWVKGFAPVIGYVAFTALQNLSGQPAISLPLHWTPEGLPVGCHFVSRFGEEETLLRLAAQLEEAMPWKDRHPPLWD